MPLDCSNRLRDLRWQRGLHSRQEGPASRHNEFAIDLYVELAHLSTDDLNVGIEPPLKLFGDGERAVAITKADCAIADRDIHGSPIRPIKHGRRPRFPKICPMR